MSPDCPLCGLPGVVWGHEQAHVCLNPVCPVFTFTSLPEVVKGLAQRLIQAQQEREGH